MKIAKGITSHLVFRRLLFAFASFCTLISFVHSQETLEYNGTYTLSQQLEGRAAYTYILKNGDKLKDGSFLFTLNLEDSIDVEYKEKYQLKGKYKDDQKVDDWEFLFSSLRPEDDEYIEDYYIKETATGEVFRINSNFKNGLPDGQWKTLAINIENSVATDTFYYSSAEFQEGSFINNIQVQNKTHQLVGEIDKNSFLHGEWIVFHNDSSNTIIEYRKYDEGILLSHNIEIDNSKYNLMYTGIGDVDNDEDLTEIPIDDTYFEILKFAGLGAIEPSSISKEVLHNIQKSTQNLISDAFNNFSKFNGYTIWDSNNEFKLPKARVKKYPFNDEDKAAIDESKKIIEETKSYFDNFLNVAQVEISKNGNDTIAKYYEVYTHYKKAFSEIKTTFTELQKPALEFLNRSSIIPKIFEGTTYPNEITYEINDKQSEVSYDFPKSLIAEETTINSIFSQLKSIKGDLKRIDAKVQPILKKEEQRADLANDEKELVEKRDSIIDKFSNKSDLNEFQKKVSTEVVSYVEREFKFYAQQSLDKRVETLSYTLDCFDQFLELYDQLEKAPKHVEEIKESYTRTVWNPFTMTDMDEIVKERVFSAYQDYLLVYFTDELEKHINCDDVENKMLDLFGLFKRMKELREQDTSELEREIKRESDPEKLIQAFQLKLNTE